MHRWTKQATSTSYVPRPPNSFEASARLAAILAGSTAEIEQACADYGQALGTAFQVIDDVLDYDGDAQEMGKTWATTCAKAR